jgi:hypothetical protein
MTMKGTTADLTRAELQGEIARLWHLNELLIKGLNTACACESLEQTRAVLREFLDFSARRRGEAPPPARLTSRDEGQA